MPKAFMTRYNTNITTIQQDLMVEKTAPMGTVSTEEPLTATSIIEQALQQIPIKCFRYANLSK